MLRILFVVVLAQLVTVSTPVVAQSQEKLYSLMLLSFARGINWPTVNNDHFVIGVIEYPPLIPELTATTANSSIHGRKIKVLHLNSMDDFSGCNILFMPAYKARRIPDVVKEIGTQPILLVTNRSDVARNGGGIDLVLRDGKLTFDINCSAIERRGLKVGSGIRGIGRNVE